MGRPRVGTDPGNLSIDVRCIRGVFKVQVQPTTTVIELKRRIANKVAAQPNKQRLTYMGQFLLDSATISSYMIGNGAIQLCIDNKRCLCPRGMEQEEMQTGVALDTILELYVNRLSHSGALEKLTHLITEGGVDLADLISLNSDGGDIVVGDVSFEAHSHILTFIPHDPLQSATLYTVTLKSELMQLKKEISELGDNVGKTLSALLDHPEYTCTFTTSASPWRKLSVCYHFENQPLPTPAALPRLQRVAITLKNDDEVLEGLKVMCAHSLHRDVDEDVDIISIHRVRDPLDGISLQFELVNHVNMASIADNETLLVMLKAPKDHENEEPFLVLEPLGQAKRQRVDSGDQASAAGRAEASGYAVAARRSARERIAEVTELLDIGMISQAEFESKRWEIISTI